MNDKQLEDLARAVVDCLLTINDLKLSKQALETALHKADDEALYHLYMAELESLRNSKANLTNIESLEALRRRLLS